MVLGMVVVSLYYKMRQILQQNATAILLQNEINAYYQSGLSVKRRVEIKHCVWTEPVWAIDPNYNCNI